MNAAPLMLAADITLALGERHVSADQAASKSNVVAFDPLVRVVRGAKAGDRTALRSLLQTLGPRLSRTVRGVLGAGHPDVEDVLQESMLAVVRSLAAFRGEGEFTGYAVRITLRTAIAARKRGRARAATAELDSIEDQPVDPSQPSSMLAARRREILRRLLEELPEAQAEALALRVVLGHSLEETAALSGAPENTIRSRIRLAREALQQRIEAEGLKDALEVEP